MNIFLSENSNGDTVLHAAANRDDIEFITWLDKSIIDCDLLLKQNKQGKTVFACVQSQSFGDALLSKMKNIDSIKQIIFEHGSRALQKSLKRKLESVETKDRTVEDELFLKRLNDKIDSPFFHNLPDEMHDEIIKKVLDYHDNDIELIKKIRSLRQLYNNAEIFQPECEQALCFLIKYQKYNIFIKTKQHIKEKLLEILKELNPFSVQNFFACNKIEIDLNTLCNILENVEAPRYIYSTSLFRKLEKVQKEFLYALVEKNHNRIKKMLNDTPSLLKWLTGIFTNSDEKSELCCSLIEKMLTPPLMHVFYEIKELNFIQTLYIRLIYSKDQRIFDFLNLSDIDVCVSLWQSAIQLPHIHMGYVLKSFLHLDSDHQIALSKDPVFLETKEQVIQQCVYGNDMFGFIACLYFFNVDNTYKYLSKWRNLQNSGIMPRPVDTAEKFLIPKFIKQKNLLGLIICLQFFNQPDVITFLKKQWSDFGDCFLELTKEQQNIALTYCFPWSKVGQEIKKHLVSLLSIFNHVTVLQAERKALKKNNWLNIYSRSQIRSQTKETQKEFKLVNYAARCLNHVNRYIKRERQSEALKNDFLNTGISLGKQKRLAIKFFKQELFKDGVSVDQILKLSHELSTEEYNFLKEKRYGRGRNNQTRSLQMMRNMIKIAIADHQLKSDYNHDQVTDINTALTVRVGRLPLSRYRNMQFFKAYCITPLPLLNGSNAYIPLK